MAPSGLPANRTFHEHFMGVWRPLILLLLLCAPFSRVASYYITLYLLYAYVGRAIVFRRAIKNMAADVIIV